MHQQVLQSTTPGVLAHMVHDALLKGAHLDGDMLLTITRQGLVVFYQAVNWPEQHEGHPLCFPGFVLE